MITKRIIYDNSNGGIAVIHPASEDTTLEDLIKIVPTGIKYKVIEESDLPNDRTNRDEWEADFSIYDGVGE